MVDDFIGKYEERSFPSIRKILHEAFDFASQFHHIVAIFDIDVTQALDIMTRYEKRTGNRPSFTGWLIKCIAQAISEYPQVQARRKGKRKLILFHDVDVALMLEKEIGDWGYPMPYILRKANEKNLEEITHEIREAQQHKVNQYTVLSGVNNIQIGRFIIRLPSFLRKLFGFRRLKNPFFAKKYAGTVAVTSVGQFIRRRGWGITISPYPILFAIGGISKQPAVIKDKIEIRECLCVTVMIDHETVDGAPMARFTNRLIELLENAYGFVDETTSSK